MTSDLAVRSRISLALGCSYLALGDPRSAGFHFQRARNLNPRRTESEIAWHYLAASEATRDVAAGVAHAERAVAAGPRDADAWLMASLALLRTDKDRAALGAGVPVRPAPPCHTYRAPALTAPCTSSSSEMARMSRIPSPVKPASRAPPRPMNSGRSLASTEIVPRSRARCPHEF